MIYEEVEADEGMKSILNGWRSDKLKVLLLFSWLLTVFFGFFGSTVLLIKIPGLPALYPFRILLPITTLIYMIWAIRERRNPWKAASFGQRVCYILCAALIVYGTISLFRAIDFEFTFTLWITLCFCLVFFALALELCSDRQTFVATLWCALITTVIHMVMGFIEIFEGGFFTKKFYEVFFFLGDHFTSPSVSAGNPNDYAMMLVFMLALVLLYWAWRGHKECFRWIPIVLIAPVYFLLGATYARLCTISFWILIAAFSLKAMTSRKLVRQVLIPALLLLALTVAFYNYGEDYQRMHPERNAAVSVEENITAAAMTENRTQVAKLTAVVPDQTQTVEKYVQEAAELLSSSAVRIKLLKHTWNCFTRSKGMGVGLGNTAQLAKPTAESRGGVWGIHCFLARMMADFGIWFLIPLLLIAFSMVKSGVEIVCREMKKRNWSGVMTGVMYLSSVLIYPIASTAPGDAQNSVPMWLFLGCVVLFPRLVRETEEI